MTAETHQNRSPRPYRVLSIDGGGMRGLYTAILLKTLALRYGRERGVENPDIGKAFDMIVGTSTGGIIACALAHGEPIDSIIDLYRTRGPEIFPWPAPSTMLASIPWAMSHFNKPSANAAVLRKALTGIFQTTTIQEVYERRGIGLCIPSVTLTTQTARVIKTPHNPQKQRDNHHPLVDVCMATSAAPLVFPIAVIDDPEDSSSHLSLVDGGLWANNPILIGMIEALDMAAHGQPIEILSVGTCAPSSGVTLGSEEEADWGLRAWKMGVGALGTALDAQSSGYTFITRMLANHFTAAGRPCQVVRLPQTPPSAQQAKHLALDLADEKAQQVLSELAKQDADVAHSQFMASSGGEREVIEGIFGSMESLAGAP